MSAAAARVEPLADPEPYDPSDEHDYLRDDPWGDR